MSWKNLALNKKIALIIGLFLIIIAWMAIITITRINLLFREATQMQGAAGIENVMLAREIDHLNWVSALQVFVLDAATETLSIQEDPTKCGLGKWYYGPERKRAEAAFPEVAGYLRDMEKHHSALHASASAIKKHRAEGNPDEARKVFAATALPSLAEVQKLMREISRVAKSEGEKSGHSFNATVSASLLAMYVGVGFALVLGLCLGIIIARSITTPTIFLSRYADKVAAGDYNAALPIKNRKDELGALADALAAMVASIVNALKQAEDKTREAGEALESAKAAQEEAEAARHAAERARSEGMQSAAARLEQVVNVVASASEELSAQVAQSERGAAIQAQNVTETATAMEEMNTTVLEVARNAANASDVSSRARDKAQEGARIVEQAVSDIAGVQKVSHDLKEVMSVLATQANSISDIMRVISDIADQTNLLALNAAIEAARAGDAGRGFAVVADEVRKLAEKTMSSTANVGSVIENIQKSVSQSITRADQAVELIEKATEQANMSGHALSEIVTMVDQSADQVQAIAAASEEQSAASEEINRTISEVNVISGQTAAAMRQAAQAVADLARQSTVLSDLVREMKNSDKERVPR